MTQILVIQYCGRTILTLRERPQCSPPPKLFPHKLETFMASLSPRQAQEVRASTDSVFWDDVPVWNG